jgi:hypothetical protein
MVANIDPDDDEPTPADLAAIEREWPLIEAELAVLDAQIRILAAAGGPTPLGWRRVRRAERQVLHAATALAAVPPPTDLAAQGPASLASVPPSTTRTRRWSPDPDWR